MKTIPAERVDALWNQYHNLSEEAMTKVVQRMEKTQPALLMYLMAMDSSFDPDDSNTDCGTCLALGPVIFFIMSTVNPALRTVTTEEIEAAEERNLSFLESLDEGREIDQMNAGTQLLSSQNQIHLFKALMEALMEGHEDQPELAPENVGMDMIYLITLIDCLDQ